MARLRNLLQTILNEFTYAQHASNNYAAQLGKEYAENNMLRYFMVPNASVNGLNFQLKFAVKSADETESVQEINYHKLHQFFSQLAVSVAETTITTALYTAEGGIAKDPANYRRLKEKEAVLRNEYYEYLTMRLRDAFIKKGINEIDEAGYPDHTRLSEIAMEVINQKFFKHPDLKLSESAGAAHYADDVKSACSSFVHTLIEHSCRDINVMETNEHDILDIIVDEKSLSEVLPETVQHISFQVNLRNYQVSKVDTSDGPIDCIIPANI